MVTNVRIGDELWYFDRTRGAYSCTILRTVESNGEMGYYDEMDRYHTPEELFYSRKEAIENVRTRIKYTNKPDLPAGTTDFKPGDKVYFIDINPYMIHDAILTLVEKHRSYAYDGYCYHYKGMKEGYYSQQIAKPFATLAEAKSAIINGKDGW